MKKNIFQSEAKKAFLIELNELKAFYASKDFNVGDLCQEILNCKGKVFLTGVGKSGHIANKIAATFSSTGTSSFFIHPAEALHGDMGMIEKNDCIIVLSKSGESKEIIDLIPSIKAKKISLFSITENENSSIAKESKVHVKVKVSKEACPNDLAPTASTTVMLALGDSIAVSLLKAKGFSSKDFARSHPGGKLGKKLTLKVTDLMIPIKSAAVVNDKALIKDVIVRISEKKQGFALVQDAKKKIVGIFSDGDLRRQLQKNIDINNVQVSKVMTKKFKSIESEKLVVDAAKFMKKNKVYYLAVNQKNKIQGFITMHEILEANVL